MSSEKTKKELKEPVSQLLQWTGFLLPPLAWSIGLETIYLFSDFGCANNDFVPIHVVAASTLLISLIGWAVAWFNWKKSGSQWPNGSGGAISRSRFMSALGMLTGPLFSALIFAQWLPTILGVPCGK